MKLYKYMSQAVGLEFIKEPFLRITPRQCLNDPFECLPSESTKEELGKFFKKSSIQVENEEMFFNDLNSFIGMHGIISLSESPDNLLMWSHYADEHKGIVVEFEVDEHDPFDLFITHSPPESSDAKFGRVSYRKSRKYPYDIDKESINSIRDYYYLSKSDEWIYEKEFRFITPYTLVNSLICNTKNTHWKKAFQVSGIPIPDKISNNIVRTDILPPIENLFPTWFHSHNTGAIFLVNINSKRINKIVLGAKADKEKFLSLMEKYECRDPYKSYYCSFSNKYINVEQAEVDPDRYELVFNKL